MTVLETAAARLLDLAASPPKASAWQLLTLCSTGADGGVWLATPVDPLLVLLPFLAAGRQQVSAFWKQIHRSHRNEHPAGQYGRNLRA